MAEALIATTAGEFSSSYLAKEAGKNIAQFIAKYGSTAFQRVAPIVTGGMILERVLEAAPPLDLQQEKLFGMPVSRITGQEQVYSDIEEPKKIEPLGYIDTVHGGKGPLPPIKAEPFPAETKVKTWDESFKAPEPIETTKGLEVPSQEKIVPPGFQKPEPLGTDILTKDIVKQTEDLVPSEDKLNEKELTFLEDISLYRKVAKPLDKKIKKLVAGEEVVFTENEHFKLRRLADIHESGEPMSLQTDEGMQEHTWDDVYLGSDYAEGFFKSDTEYENFIVKLRHLTTLAKGRTWKPEQLKFKDIAKQTKDLVTKEPEFGALTETEKQTALLEKGDKPDFYSRAIEAIKTAKDDTYTKGKWASILKSSTTKDELDYLGLTELLVGKESISKQELLNLVEGKDIASTMTVKSIPKDQMNPMYAGYSLGFEKSGTQEHIVFQIGKDKGEVGQLYKEPHFDTEHGTGTFAHARVQVGFGDSDAPPADYEDLDPKVFDKFDNTLIIDEIQSQWIQRLQKEGSAKEWKIIKGSDITKEFIEKNYESVHELTEGTDTADAFLMNWSEVQAKMVPYRRIEPDKYYTFSKDKMRSYSSKSIEEAEKKKETWAEAIADFPIKDSKKFVELVLNEMIRKAVKDGRDSIAITNGQIQYNRYETIEEKDRQGLKKFYDTFVYDQLNKIAKNYGVELERINISSEVATKEEEDNYLDQSIKRALNANYTLKKITFQELWDRTKDTDIPDHAALYSNSGRGQGTEYIQNYLENFYPDTDNSDTNWNKIKNNEVYVWKVPNSTQISWELPMIIGSHAVNHAPELQGDDLELYKKYLKDRRPPPDKELKEEQLIKMKLPKKLQNDILKKSIRLTKKIDQQTDRMFG